MVNLMTVNPMMAKTSALCHVRSLVSRQAIALAIIFFHSSVSRWRPKYVAGTSYFSSTVTGQPLSWERGQITYYTDPGELSPVLANAEATPSSRTPSVWTAVPTSTGGLSGPLEIQVVATAGTTAALRDVLHAFPAAPN